MTVAAVDTGPFAAAPRRNRLARAEALAAYGLAAPAATLLLCILILPTAATVALSFTDWQFGAATLNWVGLGNYAHLAADRVFWKSLGNTLLYVAIVVPCSVCLGLAAAILIEAGTSLRGFYRAAYFLPVTATLIAMATVWEIMLHPSIGLINLASDALGLGKHNWLKDPALALPSLAAIGIWQTLGLNMVLFLAGLKSIPRDLYEAAAIDGADGWWDRFTTVTWPMLGPATLFVLVVSSIRSFQVFDTVAVLTEGGPNKATEVLLYTMYQEGFGFFRAGYGAAVTVVFLAFVLLLTLVKVRLAERRVHYA
ncbi:MAG: sugar ABC transporter permease [Rhodospirillales bacterium]|nr:sugar ABC transporter permease [Rhodospirillales bacterium]